MRKPEWNAKFDVNSREGREVAIGKMFHWAGNRYEIPAVYLCDEGLILDYCIETDRETYRAFLEKWRYLFDCEQNGGRLGKRELLQFEWENPQDRHFHAEVWVNGKQLTYKCGHGMSWVPNDLVPVMRDEIDIKPFMKHYGLSDEKVWQFRRDQYLWGEGGIPELDALSAKLVQPPRNVPGITFPMPNPGEQVKIPNPLNGNVHTLTVLETSREILAHFRHEDLQFPEHGIVMTYRLEPDIPKDGFFLSDLEESDSPKRIGNSGNLDGAIGMIVSNRKKPDQRFAISSLHFEPVDNVIWQSLFRTKMVEDFTVSLI